jgi:hypothetical protein
VVRPQFGGAEYDANVPRGRAAAGGASMRGGQLCLQGAGRVGFTCTFLPAFWDDSHSGVSDHDVHSLIRYGYGPITKLFQYDCMGRLCGAHTAPRRPSL